jgi:hypothetical protein
MSKSFTSNVFTELKSEIKFDSYYHIVLSIAVILKIVFIICAIISFYEYEIGNSETSFSKKIIKLKDYSNETVKAIVCTIMLFLFSPFNNNYCIDRTLKILLFTYSIISIAEINWAVFIDVHPIIRKIQYFMGRPGSIKQQKMYDKLLSNEN